MDFTKTRDLFHLPEGLIYLDGNSLGPLPKSVSARIDQTLHAEWGEMLIRGWNDAGWMAASTGLGDRIGRLIGAEAGSVIVGDTLSLKVHQCLAAAVALRPDRKGILSDTGNFPSDLYMAQGIIEALGKGHDLKLVEPEAVLDAIDESLAVVLITEVDYRTGRLHDMAAIIEKAHACGALVVWDLAHSAGAIEVDLSGAGADFAAGCTYKYLNAGPGAPAFIYVAPHLQEQIQPALSGWLGHAAPFAFDLDYRPGDGISRMRVGTPPVLAMAALDASLAIWDDVDMAALRVRSIELTELFIAEVEARCPDLILASPRDPHARGSQVSFRHAEGYAIMQALIAQGVIGDFRAPDITRFGFTPLYTSEADVVGAAEILERIMTQKLWDTPEFKTRKAVT